MESNGTRKDATEGRHRVAVVGAGAAGIVAAIFAARSGARTVLLETRRVPGAKIRVSGGGRCNVLPVLADLADFHTSGSRNPLRNVLGSWPLAAVRAFFEEDLGLALKEEPPGKVFPASDRSRDVVDALVLECRRRGVELRGSARIESLDPPSPEGSPRFRLRCEDGEELGADRVILATGGLSLPRTGSDGSGLRIARSLGHSVLPTFPALVPLTTSESAWTALAGVSLRVTLRAVQGQGARVIEEREGELLFTHRGFSGPVVLDLSRHVARPDAGHTRLLAAWRGRDAPDWEPLLLEPGKRSVATILREHLPRRLVDRLLDVASLADGRTTSELRRDERCRLVEALTACPLSVDGNEGYAKAEVTAGGVPLAEVRSKTLESRLVPGLHFAGEILDVDARIGGYNFLWAWVSGRRAGEGAAES